jgi:hypothetical protein
MSTVRFESNFRVSLAKTKYLDGFKESKTNTCHFENIKYDHWLFWIRDTVLIRSQRRYPRESLRISLLQRTISGYDERSRYGDSAGNQLGLGQRGGLLELLICGSG